MSPEEREKLRGSLFKPTSAFVQPVDVPYPVEVVIPQVVSSSFKRDWDTIADLISHILLTIDDRRGEANDLVRDIENDLVDLEREVLKHA